MNTESPCISVCTIDHNDVCVGCGRTLEYEIAKWSTMTDEQKHRVNELATQRLNR
jgi:predicted Fe-S protein YdhL (DUF1289 family)